MKSAGRPMNVIAHKPVWRISRLVSGAPRPAGPGPVGWNRDGGLCPHRRREQAGRQRTDLPVKLPSYPPHITFP